MKRLRPVMFVGTGSDVGKSVVNTGFCRIFLQDGYTPAPFKAQNMSLNSYVTKEGFEIGTAQAIQAEACGIDCMVEMNPVLLKPSGYLSSQLIINGKVSGNKSASEYFNHTDRDKLFKNAAEAYNRLHEVFNPIVIEGAGSISEMNLWDKDIVNMRMAEYAGAATYLVADIDKGGVFASVYGSIMLLPQARRSLIQGIIINKFRGDITLFEEGKKIIKNLTGKPVVGVIPYFKDIFIEQEDSLCIENKNGKAVKHKINIAVALLRHMSNFTDFNMLEHLAEVHLYYTDVPEELANADIVILPGSKNTLSDLQYLRNKGMASAIVQRHKQGKPVYGICGGYQMMGTEIHDPHHVEGNIDALPGLGILPITTSLTTEKQTRQCEFRFLDSEETCTGYEIHMGQSIAENPQAVCKIGNVENDGYFLNPQTWGSYIHGIFNNQCVVEYILKQIKNANKPFIDYKTYKQKNYNKLADLIRENVDMAYIYKTMQL